MLTFCFVAAEPLALWGYLRSLVFFLGVFLSSFLCSLDE
jgi:hypothetical protein